MEYVVTGLVLVVIGYFIYKSISREKEYKGEGLPGVNPRDKFKPPRDKE